MSQSSQEIEPSLREYARFYGLTRDHLDPHPLKVIPGLIDLWQDLGDLSSLFDIDTNDLSLPTERIAIGIEAASFLAAATSLQSKQTPRFDEDASIRTHHVRDLKFELPLLRTDHELDVLRFKQRAQPDLDHEFLPIETVDVETDEGLAWPSRFSSLPNDYWNRALSEKVTISSDMLLYLRQTLQWHTEGGEHKSFEDIRAEPSYMRRKEDNQVTPPMLPMSPEILPYEPSSETGKLDLLSEATGPASEELREAEAAVFKSDSIAPIPKLETSSSQYSEELIKDSDSLGDVYSPLKGLKDPPSSPPRARMLVQECKVEVPLSPPVSDEMPPWKRKKNVSFSDAITEAIPDIPDSIQASESNPEEDIDNFFEQSIAPIAIKAEQCIEQEQLQEADTTRRISVPLMDFSRPKPPWECSSSNPDTKEMIADVTKQQNSVDSRKSYWRLSGKVERELTWVAFPTALANAATQEHVGENGSELEFIQPPECVDPETLIWKPEGLRIFDDVVESDEEELEQGNFPDGMDIVSLTRKRKLELEDEAEEKGVTLARMRLTAGTGESFQTFDPSSGQQINAGPMLPNALALASSPLHNTGFSALTALDGYLAVRSGEINASTMMKSESDGHVRMPDSSMSPVNEGHATGPVVHSTKVPAKDHVNLALPAISLPHDTRQFILSTTFLQNRDLVRRILKLYPTADIIERDWTAHRPVRSALPINDRPVEEPDSISSESDIITSPNTGLVTTLLQKLKQRSLPGQTSHSALRERIYNAAPRYERLLVLVCYDYLSLGLDSEELSTEDQDALASFKAFCSSLPSDVSVILVAGGADHLAHRIVALMARYSIAYHEVKLAQDEMPAELFLRSAGMNAFASQAVILALSDIADQTVELQGQALSMFVQMSLHEKIARFKNLLGGQRVLSRVHSILETRWWN